ncbi:uncharacterized protein LOC111912428 [Lactuca sativa]|uniref:DC1 domain-containing protein n=1 Tax=Lactuca sativa TaxID=4236 RepID=A0A9R1UE37_LACSA|nr:uncharacterized protein LOC111912428 [Lactuca sativa]KAJ0185431.1 hypothetical protein LSAT_V11C900482630 [Lactuca sativa]
MAPLQRSTSAIAPQRQPDQLQIHHFTHQHPVHKLFMAFEFTCDGCKTRGYGVRYRCSACNFDLHEHCATAAHRLQSHVHPHHQIVLVNRPGTSHFCDVCKGFTDGLSYTCQTCEFDVHTLCTQIPVATGVPKLKVDPCQQQQGGVQWAQPTTAFGGHHQNQPVVMVNQFQQGVPASTTAFVDYYGTNNGKPVQMMNHQQYHHQQQLHQQGVSTTAFGGYQGVNNNNNQAVMINQHHHHHQQLQQQQQQQAFGGYQNQQFGGYNNQPVMINQQQQQQQQQGNKSSTLSNVGKIAANVLMTSLIGVPINFNSRK